MGLCCDFAIVKTDVEVKLLYTWQCSRENNYACCEENLLKTAVHGASANWVSGQLAPWTIRPRS